MSVNSLQKKSQNGIQFFWQFFRRFFRLITVAAILLAALSVPAGSGAGAKDKVGRLPKDSVASNQLRMLDGRSFSLSDLRGQVVVLDFFAIWCGHSKQHIPTMTRFNNEDNKRGLQIIGLAVKDGDSTPDRISKFIRDHGINYPVGMIRDPEFVSYVDSSDVSVPQTLVFARDGRLVAHFRGHDDNIASELTSVIRRELEK